MQSFCPKLIEVALPIREVSFESARDKSIRHGHISTLHLWWARRPLPASRAIVFASLVPDPDNDACPQVFKDKVKELLSSEMYRPYTDIPHTAERDAMPDTLRNRLLMFIGKFSDAYCQHEIQGRKAPSPAETLTTGSLVKWESAIDADRVLKIARELVLVANDGVVPKVFDPFAGGGAIPLEAARLGCDTYANDLNPVAHLVELCSLTYPQTYGKPHEIPKEEYERTYGHTELSQLAIDGIVKIPNRLSHDVAFWANWILKQAENEIGHLYPKDEEGRKSVAYMWVRTVTCSNPTCRATVPLFRSMWLCKTPTKKVAIRMIVDKESKKIRYEVVQGKSIDFDPDVAPNKRGDATCLICNAVTSVEEVRLAGLRHEIGEEIVAVVMDGQNGKAYRSVIEMDRKAHIDAGHYPVDAPAEGIPENQWNIKTWLYGMNTWGSLFNHRQLLAIQTFGKYIPVAIKKIGEIESDGEYARAVAAYLGLWIDRIVQDSTRVGRWDSTREGVKHPFSRQAIAMTWDYPEVNLFGEYSGSAISHLDLIIRYIERENVGLPCHVISGSAVEFQSVDSLSLSAVVTDPPYYDAIAYADLSDFYYVWLKRSIGPIFPDVFKTPLTPKTEEATSLKHRHDSNEKAKEHFESMLTKAFREASRLIKNDGVVSIMFAHQSTEAWTAFVKAILDADLNITASWPIDTEMKNKVGAVSDLGASYLASSVTVVCRKRNKGTTASFKDVRKELERVVAESLDRFWSLGFRGADLIVSTFGPAVGVFGGYERVEKADGSTVEVAELLNLVRELAFKKIVGGLKVDDLSRLYVGWLNLYGIGLQEWDDARQTMQMSTDIDIQEAVAKKIFIKDGDKVRIALLSDRESHRLGEDQRSIALDKLHRAMSLWIKEDRNGLIEYLARSGAYKDEDLWKLAQALYETIPNGHPDWKAVQAMLAEKQTLMNAAKQVITNQPVQENLNI